MKHHELFIEASSYLVDHRDIPQEEFKTICAKHNVNIEIKRSEEEYALDY